MSNIINLSVDISHNTIKYENYPIIKLPKCKGLLILNFLNQHQDKPFSPTLLRLNIENYQELQNYQQIDEYSYLMKQATKYIPATDRQTITEVIKEYKKNLLELDEARKDNDDSKVAYLIDQNEMLSDYLSKSVNFNYTIKNINQTKTNDYKSVKRALDNLIKFIALENQDIAKKISDNLVINSGQICLLSAI